MSPQAQLVQCYLRDGGWGINRSLQFKLSPEKVDDEHGSTLLGRSEDDDVEMMIVA